MIIEEYDESLFISRFEDYERVGEGKDFSYSGLRALFNYLDEISSEEEPYKLDVIALCCDYTEYFDLEDYLNNYKEEKEDNETDEEFKERIEEELNDKTTLIKLGDDLDEGFIVQNY